MKITVLKLKHALLLIPTNEATIVEEAVGGFVDLLKRLIVIDLSLSQASQGPSRVPNQVVEGNKCIKKRIEEKKKLITIGGTTKKCVTTTTFV